MFGGTWSRDPIRRSTATGAAVIDFTDLGVYEELLLEIRGLQTNVGTPDFLVQLSDDNGSTWNTTTYVHAGATGTSGFTFCTSVAAATSVAADLEIVHFNVATQTWASRINGGREGASTGARSAPGYNSTASAWNALRVTNSTATNFTANGGISLYMRQPQ